MKDYVEFSNGQKMPVIGLGTWSAKAEEMRTAVNAALEAGYRHIDTAFTYMNEEAIGQVLNMWISEKKIKREELFIVTKLPMVGNRQVDVEKYIKESLKRLNLDYVDLYIVHAPLGLLPDKTNINNVFPVKDANGTMDWDKDTDLVSVWKGMEAQVDAGRAKSIGLSNFNEKQVRRVMKDARIKPANLQVEIHAYFMQRELRSVCAEFGITVCAYSPLGSPGRQFLYDELGVEGVIPDILQNPIVTEIAERHKRTPAQVLLRFLAQNQIVVIPKSTNPTRIADNYKIFDFELLDEDIKKLDTLDKGIKGRTYDWTFFKGAETHPEYPFGQ